MFDPKLGICSLFCRLYLMNSNFHQFAIVNAVIPLTEENSLLKYRKHIRHSRDSLIGLCTKVLPLTTMTDVLHKDFSPFNGEELLKSLSPLLDERRGILSEAEIPRILQLMNNATKRSRLTYMKILKATASEKHKLQYLDTGGWNLLSNWLSESVTDSDWTSVEDLLNLFLELPVTVDLLRQNQTPKVIKLLSKRDDASYRVKALSTDIVTIWKDIIIDETGGTDKGAVAVKPMKKPNGSPSGGDVTVLPSSDKSTVDSAGLPRYIIPRKPGPSQPKPRGDPNIDIEEEEEESNSDSDDIVSRSQLNQNGPENNSKALEVRRDSTNGASVSASLNAQRGMSNVGSNMRRVSNGEMVKSPSADNIFDKLRSDAQTSKPVALGDAKIQQQQGNSGVPAKRVGSDSGLSQPKGLQNNGADDKGGATPISRQPKSKKTVRTYQSQFRNLGFEDESESPLPKKPKTAGHKDSKPSNLADSKAAKRSSTDDLKSKVPEKKPRPNVTIPIEAAARVESHESTGSNDGSPLSPTAVVSAVKPEVNPKPKERPQPAKTQLVESVGFMQALELPKQSYMRRKKINPVAKPESNPSASTSPPRDPSDAQSPTMKTEETSVRPAQFYKDTLGTDARKTEQSDSAGPSKSSVTSVSGMRTKKQVRWVKDSHLVQTKFFEVEEGERVNVLRAKMKGGDMKHMEMMLERQKLDEAKKHFHTGGEETLSAWKMIPIILPDSGNGTVRGSRSTEVHVQQEREKRVLQELFLTGDSPKEPDFEMITPTDPRTIPLEDAVIAQPASALPPELSNLFGSLVKPQAAATVGPSEMELMRNVLNTIGVSSGTNTIQDSPVTAAPFPSNQQVGMNMPPQQMTFLPPPMGMMPPNVGGGQMGLPFMPGMMPPFGAPMMPPNQGMMTGMMPGYQPNVPGQWINQPRPTGMPMNNFVPNHGRGGFNNPGVCRFWLQGNCWQGNSCKFQHTPKDSK